MYTYAISFSDGVVMDPAWREAIAKAKLKRIEFSCNYAITTPGTRMKAHILAAMEKQGSVKVDSIHIPFGGGWSLACPLEAERRCAEQNIADFIQACDCLPCKNYTLHGCLEPVKPEERKASIQAFRTTVTNLLPLVQKRGISLNIEILPRTCLANTSEELAEMIDGLPEENVGVCFDVNHLCGCPEKIADGLKLLAKRIRSLHISDYDGIDECHWYPGFGVINWPEVMSTIKGLPNDLVLIFECVGFLKVSPWGTRPPKDYAIDFRGMERNIFYLENCAELNNRISDIQID